VPPTRRARKERDFLKGGSMIGAEAGTRDIVVRVTGVLDLDTVPGVAREITLALTRASRALHVDLSKVEFCDSSGLSMLVRARAHAHGRGLQLVLVDPSPSVRQVLELTRVGGLFTIDD
jgi:anti-sigma B factor antagonist